MIIKKILALTIPVLLFFSAHNLLAAELSVSPAVIDEIVKAKDILEYDIKIKNNSDKNLIVYTVVNDFSPEQGMIFPGPNEKFDRKDHASQWVEIKRGQEEAKPRSEISVPLEIKVSMYAIPGKYYAIISFVGANDYYEATALAREGKGAQLFVALNLEEKIIEKAELLRFNTKNSFNLKPSVDFDLKISNIGNIDIKPEGHIYIYDRRGAEVKDININETGMKTGPDDFFDISKNWASGKNFGKFRARLIGEYGAVNKRDFQDVIYFWILPWKFLLIGSVLFLAFVILMSLILFGRPRKAKKTVSSNQFKNKDNKNL